MKLSLLSITLFTALPMHSLWAAPVTGSQAQTAAQEFVARRYPAPDAASARSTGLSGPSRLAVRSVESLSTNGTTLGFISHLEPSGYLLLRADDAVPAVKLYSDTGAFSNLPPEFVIVMRAELAGELAALTTMTTQGTPPPAREDWSLLLGRVPLPAQGPGPDTGPNTVLVQTTWDQDDPYNLYSPVVAGAPAGYGGRTPNGCVAVAMAQILRYHQKPARVLQDHTYYDGAGTCTGTHSMSEAGLTDYDWANMPLSLTTSSPLAQKQAVARLIHHCGVAVGMDFEADGSGAWSYNVPGALTNYFGFACPPIVPRSQYANAAWYNLIAADIDAQKPIYYSFQTATAGHAVVCDGYRNGNEIHLNLGWGGSDTAWYNMDNIATSGGTFAYYHQAVLGITPPTSGGLSAPVLAAEPAVTPGSSNTISWSAVSPATSPRQEVVAPPTLTGGQDLVLQALAAAVPQGNPTHSDTVPRVASPIALPAPVALLASREPVLPQPVQLPAALNALGSAQLAVPLPAVVPPASVVPTVLQEVSSALLAGPAAASPLAPSPAGIGAVHGASRDMAEPASSQANWHDGTVPDFAIPARATLPTNAIGRWLSEPENGGGELPPMAWQTLMSEGFEYTFPNGLWQAYDNTGGVPYWGVTTYSAYSGSRSIWCAGSGLSAAGGAYANDMISWLTYGPFNLAGAQAANLSFYFQNSSELNYDYFGWYYSTDGVNYTGSRVSGALSWQSRILDLAPALGQSQVWVAFVFQSDSSVNGYAGTFVDNVVLQKDTAGQPDLTPYQPANWNNKIPVGTTQLYGTNAHSYTGSFYDNQTLYFNRSVINQGAAAAGANRVHVELVNSSGTLVNSWNSDLTSLDIGYYSYWTQDAAVGPLAAGTYTFKVWADSNGTVAESNESNNYYERTITVLTTLRPDLTPYQPANWNDKLPVGTTQLYGTNTHSYTGSFYDNQTLYFNWSEINQGTAAAGGYRVHVVVTGTGGGTWDWDIASAAVSSYRSLTLDQAVGPLAAGTHTIQMSVDYNNTVAESNESNNYYERTITVLASAWPDLAPYQPANWNNKLPVGTTQLYATNTHNYTGSFYDNQTLYFNWATLNQGTAAAGGYRVHVVVTGTGGGTWDWDVSSQAANYYLYLNLDQAVGPLAAGSHTIQMWVDYNNTVTETNESNNYYERTITVGTTTAPDLTPFQPTLANTTISWNDKIPVGTTQLSGTDAHSYSGSYNDNQTLYFNWAIANLGNDTASNYTVRIEVTGTGGSTNDYNGLALPANSFSIQGTDRAVGPLSAGPHTFKVYADYYSTVQETNESNNYYERTINVLSSAPVEYYAECANNSGFSSPANSGWTTNTQWTFSSLAPGQTYWYRVKARQGANESAWSNTQFSQQQPLSPAISVTPASQNYGSIPVGTTTDRSFSVTNTGGGTLSGAATVSSPYSIVSGGTYSLGANQGQAVVVRYSPVGAGTHTTNVTFTGGGGSVATVTGAGFVQSVLQFTVGTSCGPQFAQVLVPVQVTRFTDVSSFQFSYHWDPAVATFVGVEQFGLPGLALGNFGTTLINSGSLTVSWDDADGTSKSLADGTTLFAVRLQLVGSPGATSPVTIDGIPTALEAANGALAPIPVATVPGQVCISRSVTVSGAVAYYGPSNAAPSVAGVTMNLTGDTNLSTQTASDGTYSFVVNVGGNGTITPTKLGDSPAANGVSTVDISLIRRHVLNIAPLDSPYKLLAADVNGSRSVTTIDITLIRRVILGITNAYPIGLWRLVPTNYAFANPLSPWDAPAACSYTNLAADLPNQRYVAMKLGDVNNSWTPPAGAMALMTSAAASAEGSRPAVRFQVSTHTAQLGDTVTAQVTVSGFDKVTSAQFTLDWDPAVLGYLGTAHYGLAGISTGNFGIPQSDSGRLAFSWDDPSATGVTLPDKAVVFTVTYQVKGKSGSATALALTDSSAPREVGVEFAAVPFHTQNGRLSVGLPEAPRLTPVGYGEGEFRVSTPTLPGRLYTLEFTDSLAGGSWKSLPAVVGDGAVKILTDVGAAAEQRFYRVRVE